jgi:hypothetical protein
MNTNNPQNQIDKLEDWLVLNDPNFGGSEVEVVERAIALLEEWKPAKVDWSEADE